MYSPIDDSKEVIPLLLLCVFQGSPKVLTLFCFGFQTSAGSGTRRWMRDLCLVRVFFKNYCQLWGNMVRFVLVLSRKTGIPLKKKTVADNKT